MEESMMPFSEEPGEHEEDLMAFNSDPVAEARASQYSPLNLAYVGDAVFELYVRTVLVKRGNMPVGRLHKAAVNYVSSSAQAVMSEAITELLDEKEKRIVRRGENARPHSISKNADPVEHEKATGLEALVGYLYLKGDGKRLIEIIEAGMEAVERRDT